MGSSASSSFDAFSRHIFSSVSQQKNGQNVFLSPVSIALAMSMCTAGARQKTLQQMLRVLEASSTEQLVERAEQAMRLFSLADRDSQVQLKLANRLYAQKAYTLQEDYLSLVRERFQADVKLVDFAIDGAKAVSEINAWVEERTNKLIQNLLASGDVSDRTRLIIVNCIYFKGTWVTVFKERSTNLRADFYQANGTISKIKLMYMKDEFAYLTNTKLGVQVAHIPYRSDDPNLQFVFSVILPNRDVRLDDVERQLQAKPALLKQLLSQDGASERELELHLPKFKMEATCNLNDVLVQLGMSDAFTDGKADFTGMIGDQNNAAGLFIDKVIHKAFIDVNEQGSEAAAATAVECRLEACASFGEPEPIEFKADRPFLFYIREVLNNTVLFTGKLVTPPVN